MTQVNLLPPDIREKNRSRQVTATVILAVAAVMALLMFVFFLQSAGLTRAQRDLDAQQAANAKLEAQISRLQKFADLKQARDERQALKDTLVKDLVLFSGVLGDVSKVIPGEMYLTAMTATTQAGVATGGAATASSSIIGTIQFQGVASDQPTIALWLTRLEEVTGWVNAWISSDTVQTENGVSSVQFSGTVDITHDATTNGGRS